MKKTPKYKAYDIKQERIIEEVSVTSPDENFDWAMKSSSDGIILNPSKCEDEYIIMKHTERVDKEGTPIYEGYKLNIDEESFVVSEWENAFILTDLKGATKPLHPLCRKLKIVGHIYEKNIFKT